MSAAEFRGPAGLTRREVLQMFASAAAVAALPGCFRAPREPIVPYVRTPTGLAPGEPLRFATAVPVAGFGIGAVATSREGRPTKLEGNPDHPASRGGTDVFVQASVFDLYDPDRARTPLLRGAATTWEETRDALSARAAAHRAKRGEGLAVLVGRTTSPTLVELLARLRDDMPRALLFAHEPLASRSPIDGLRAAFGVPVVARPRLDRARVVVSLDADFLGAGPAAVRHARDFAAARRVRAGSTGRARLHVLESGTSITGSVADHRFALRPSEAAAAAFALHRRVFGGGVEPRFPWIDAVASDLERSPGAGLVVVGDTQPAEVHALAAAVNERLDAPVEYADPVDATWDWPTLEGLAREIDAGRVETLVVLGTNPAYTAPADLEFAALLDRVPFTFHLGLHADETAQRCIRHAPAAHFLESWDDVRAFDGTASIVQPLIAPLYGGRTAAQIVALLLDGRGRSDYDLVRGRWRQRLPTDEPFESAWRRALREGVVAGTGASARPVRVAAEWSAPRAVPPESSDRLEAAFRPDSNVLDGRFAGNAWLQETPRPLTKIAWDNAALVSAGIAARLGVATGDVVAWTLRGRTIEAPAWVVRGGDDGCVVLPLGYGRRLAGAVGTGVGFDAYRLRAAAAPWNDVGLVARRTGARHEFACTQWAKSMEGRDIARSVALPRIAAGGEERRADAASLFPPRAWDGPAWAMSIDLGACIGCNACVVACVAENNVPTVGRDEVMRGRAMQWLRIDTYDVGGPSSGAALHQPVPCMHCENAPCEVVCPVGATVHSHEGLNEQVYNRCVGTRYCSNNCPWKVRRFNFFAYARLAEPPLALARNPDVTVRSRGVMEKCTYCVQRIERARIAARREDRPMRDGDVVTACEAACPTQAIVFGDRNDAASRVARLKREPHDYALLGELGTRPRTTYLAHVSDSAPGLAPR